MTPKVAIVTGGASGIGKSIAMVLARRGIAVVIGGRRESIGRKTIEEIRAQGGESAFIAADVDDEAQIRQMVEFTINKYGHLDLAVNNAGIGNETSAIADSDPARFREMLRTNILGMYLCMKYEIQEMIKNGRGSIVNLTSIAGVNGIPYVAPYSATKHAVVGLTKSAALEYATQNIRINAVAPGAIKTEIVASNIAQGKYDEAAAAAMHPMARMGNPDEVAHGIAWLLSDEASFVTGHVLNIDGGFHAK
jgi:NAD(P)-dependent dehydrogenase (short-subunit alcohol dehydrogenase family)